MTIEQVKDIFDVFSVMVREDNYSNEYTFDVAYYAHEIIKCTEYLKTEFNEWNRNAYNERIDMAMKKLEQLLG